MNSDLKSIALLFGQLTSTILAVVVIWIGADSDTGKALISFLPLSPMVFKVLLTALFVVGGFIGIAMNIKILLKKVNKDDTNG